MKLFEVLHGDCLEELKKGPDNSIDALVTDPPAGIAFMNKEWDKDKGGRDAWVKWMTDVMTEAYRVMKPGAHGLVWALPRTSHWTATALENAGFEVRDVVTHLFGTGFPKSLDISKAIDKAAGAERETLGPKLLPNGKAHHFNIGFGEGEGFASEKAGRFESAPSTDAAKQWQGWGTALKPASEHWILVRKPLSEPTVAKNVLKWGVGGLNIDASRIGSGDDRSSGGIRKAIHETNPETFQTGMDQKERPSGGRFPANLVLDEEAAAALDGQSSSPKGSDGASRFFYVAKASASEKNAGLDDAEPVKVNDGRETAIDNPFQRGETLRKNTHPTVKSLKLMEYLIKLITPPGGIVLDPFMGSGSTGVACQQLGMQFIGIEQQEEYITIAKKRLNVA